MQYHRILHQTNKIIKDHVDKNLYRILLFIGVGIILPYIDRFLGRLIHLDQSQERLAVILFFLAFPFLLLPGRTSLLGALFTIILCIPASILHKYGVLEQLGIYTFYFLVVGVFWIFFETIMPTYQKKLIDILSIFRLYSVKNKESIFAKIISK